MLFRPRLIYGLGSASVINLKFGRKSSSITKYRFLGEALDAIEFSTSTGVHGIVLLSPESGDNDVKSDEEEIDDENLATINPPQEVPGITRR
ncbi:hypothetical protein FQR65_LT02364 [Abscondita terminalis]|nr:hypothetical protein FQR65_LT02364 [Abscondita terminalis]